MHTRPGSSAAERQAPAIGAGCTGTERGNQCGGTVAETTRRNVYSAAFRSSSCTPAATTTEGTSTMPAKTVGTEASRTSLDIDGFAMLDSGVVSNVAESALRSAPSVMMPPLSKAFGVSTRSVWPLSRGRSITGIRRSGWLLAPHESVACGRGLPVVPLKCWLLIRAERNHRGYV